MPIAASFLFLDGALFSVVQNSALVGESSACASLHSSSSRIVGEIFLCNSFNASSPLFAFFIVATKCTVNGDCNESSLSL
jgi:hypothetical protein